MSTEYQAMIVVGLHTDQIENQDLLDNEIDVYDDVSGFAYRKTGWMLELDYTESEIEILKQKLLSLTGQDAKIYLTTWSF